MNTAFESARRVLLRRIVPVAVAAYGTAAVARYGLIEREDLGILCESLTAPWWCGVRLLTIRAFLLDLFGLASLAFLVVGYWRRSPLFALAAIAAGTIGMVLYSFFWSGVGVLGGLLLAGRLQSDRDEDRKTQAEY
jgi:hypothetical protein